jgi:hypothetical protein
MVLNYVEERNPLNLTLNNHKKKKNGKYILCTVQYLMYIFH